MAVTEQEFALKVKEKYPEYKDVDDKKLVSSVLKKYPEYQDQVIMSEVKPERTQPISEIPEEDKGIISSVVDNANEFAGQFTNILPNLLNAMGDAGNLQLEFGAKYLDWFLMTEERGMESIEETLPEPLDFKPLFEKAGIGTSEEPDSFVGRAGKFTGEAIAINTALLKGARAIRAAEKMLTNPGSRSVAKNALIEIENDAKNTLGKFIATEGGAIVGLAGSQELLEKSEVGTGTKLLLEVMAGLGGAITGRTLASAPKAFVDKFGKLTVNELKAGVAKGDITYKDLEWVPMLRQEAPKTPKETPEALYAFGNGEPISVNSDGTITLYHRTNANPDEIKKSGFVSKENTDEIFVSTKRDGQGEGYGENVVELKVKQDDLEIDDLFDDEAHFRVSIKKANEALKTPKTPKDAPEPTMQGMVPKDETRGKGIQYHGTSSEIKSLNAPDDNFGDLNIYGQGFYTTEAADIAKGYSKKGKGKTPSIYSVDEINPVKFMDIDNFKFKDLNMKLSGEYQDVINNLPDDSTVRQVMDAIKSDIDETALEIQEMAFFPINDRIKELGYGGIQHIGGRNFNKKPHKVKIYFDPSSQIKINKLKETPTMQGIVEESKVFNEVKQEFTNSLERKAIADTIAANNSIDSYTPSGNPLIRAGINILKAVAPSKIAGRKNVLDIDKAKGLITAAEKTGSILRSKIEQFVGKGRFRSPKPEVEAKVNAYLDGGEMDPELEPIRPFLEKYRDIRNQQSEELMKALDDDAVSMLPQETKERLFETIRQSIDENSYNAREYRMYTDPKFTPSSAQRKKAEIEIAESLRSSMGISYDEALSLASKQLDYLVGRSARTAKAKPGGYVPRAFDGPIKRKNLSIGPEQRKFLGEITEPGERIFGTLSRQARLLSARQMDLAIARNLIDEGLATTVQTPSNNIQLPLATADGPSGIYVSDEVASSISKLRMGNTVTRSNNEVANVIFDTWNTLVGVGKATRVLLNVISYAPAAYGNAAMSAASAIFNAGDLKRGITLAISEFGWIRDFITNKNGEVARRLLDDIESMSKYNLNTQGIVASDIRDSFRRSLISGAAEKILSPFSKLYSVLDVGFRYMTWKGSQRQLSKMFPDATDEQIRQSAAALTNDTFQQYDKVSDAFKTLSRLGIVNPFGTFGAEIVRNMYNQGKYAGQMAKGTFGRDVGLDPSTANVEEMKKIGAKRIAALTAVGAGTTAGIRTLNKSQGLDLESEREFGETIAPFYDETKQLVIIPDKTGRSGTYFNPSYLVPQTIGTNAFMAGLKGKSLESAMDSIIDEFIGEGSFVFQAVGQISMGRDERGELISLSAEEVDQLKAKAKLFYKVVLEPSTFREAEKWEKAIKDIGTLDEFKLIGRLLGLRYNAWDAQKSGINKFREATGKMREAKSRYSRALNRTDYLPKEKEDIYNQMNSDRRSQFNEIAKHYNNLSGGTWKFTMDERIQMMKEAKMPSSDILDIIDGTYTDMPKTKTLRTSEIYDELEGTTPKEKLNSMKSLQKQDPGLYKRLVQHQKRLNQIESRNLTEREKLISSLDVDKRVDYLISVGADKNRALLREYVRKGIATKSVREALSLKNRGY